MHFTFGSDVLAFCLVNSKSRNCPTPKVAVVKTNKEIFKSVVDCPKKIEVFPRDVSTDIIPTITDIMAKGVEHNSEPKRILETSDIVFPSPMPFLQVDQYNRL